MFKYLSLVSSAAILLCSCQKSYNTTELANNPYLKNYAIELNNGSLEVSLSEFTESLEKLNSTSNHEMVKEFSDQLISQFPSLDSDSKAFVAYQLYQSPNHLPILPGASFTLSSKSLFDGNAIPIKLKAPSVPSESSELIIFLGNEDQFPSFKGAQSSWVAFIPSRETFNYQVLAEGDFLHAVDDIEKMLPQIEKVEKILIGVNESSRAALYFANFYPNKFHKVAWSGLEDGFEFQNLDEVPITYYESEAIPPFPFTGEQLISRLQNRGNHKAFFAASLDDSIAFLNQSELSDIKTYRFRDYQHAFVAPWLSILHKDSESDEGQVYYEKRDHTVHIDTTNVSHLVLYPSKMPSSWDINSVRFNDETWTCSKGMREMVLGPINSLEKVPLYKTKAPSSFIDYFRNERTVIVYQDKNIPPDLLRKVKTCAERLSALSFKGFPKHQAKLPIAPLSEYNANKHGQHRVIYWGMESGIAELANKEEGFSPLRIWNKDLFVSGTKVKELNSYPKSLTYMLSTHLFDDKSLPSCLLVAEDISGFEQLEREWLSLTSLYKDKDFEAWEQYGSEYGFLAEYSFGGFYGSSEPSHFLFHNPFRDKETWSQIISEYLQGTSLVDGIITSSYFSPLSYAPDEFYKSTIDTLIKDKTYSVLKLKGWEGAQFILELKNLIPDIQTFGIADTASRASQPWPSDLEVSVLVDNDVLKQIPGNWLNSFEYSPLPQSLKEIVQKGFDEELPFFQYEMERIAQENQLEDFHG